MGGHYHVWLRAAHSADAPASWYDFNDSCVTALPADDVATSLAGAAEDIDSSAQTTAARPRRTAASSNAYMLMYRRRVASGEADRCVHAPGDLLAEVERSNETVRPMRVDAFVVSPIAFQPGYC